MYISQSILQRIYCTGSSIYVVHTGEERRGVKNELTLRTGGHAQREREVKNGRCGYPHIYRNDPYIHTFTMVHCLRLSKTF